MEQTKLFPLWGDELKDLLYTSNSIAIGWFSEDGSIIYANTFMKSLLGELGSSAFLNPLFEVFSSSSNPDGIIFEGYITFKLSSPLNSSLLSRVFKKGTEILITGGIDVELMINQNSMMFTLNQEVNDLQRKLIDEKIVLQNTLKKLELANQELVSLNMTKDKFFSIIAHDLRSPFHGFLGLTEMLADKETQFTKEEFRSYSDSLNKTAQGLYSLLENLLKWSQIQRNQIQINKRKLLVSEVINHVINQLKPIAQLKEIDLSVQLTETMYVFADDNMIQTILRNLISNAIKFTWRKGKILITCTRENTKSVISVIDNGKGISVEDQEKLFRIDTRFSSEGTEGEASTGLGLLLCKEFAEKNDGSLSLTSQPGKGSTFTLTVPLAVI